ncbi:hypothetical protein DM01DRAFT_1333875 [Hesseltinella vesiculosa]|uniref:Pentacotripeptide-repeat region of PRORP domain-containing protein n=1 Tax=Hesseltinella vesiculosa TaxID=101127 RepID=A0A1X2GP06_9FUNG|nr:hypothetical protein DM01DRAFT_1333875 [Hesseltinella vesiculosa]
MFLCPISCIKPLTHPCHVYKRIQVIVQITARQLTSQPHSLPSSRPSLFTYPFLSSPQHRSLAQAHRSSIGRIRWLTSTSSSSSSPPCQDPQQHQEQQQNDRHGLLRQPLQLPHLHLPLVPDSSAKPTRHPLHPDTTLHTLLDPPNLAAAVDRFVTTAHCHKDSQRLAAALAEITADDLAQLLSKSSASVDASPVRRRRLDRLVKTLADMLPLATVHQLLSLPSTSTSDDLIMRALFSRYAKHYVASDDKEQCLATTLAMMTGRQRSPALTTWLFNILLDKCLAVDRNDHVQRVLQHMKTSGCALDVATYNLLIRSQLSQRQDEAAARALYQELLNSSIHPSTATFNTFLRYSIDQQAWDQVSYWMDQLDHHHVHPNAVTLRILMAGIAGHSKQPQLQLAFDHVVSQVDLANEDLEHIINISASHMLREHQTEAALDALGHLFRRLPMAALSLHSHNIYLHALAQFGDMVAAEELFQRLRHSADLPDPDVVTYTTLIHGYIRTAPARHVNLAHIVDLYQDMVDQKMATNVHLQAVLLFGMIKSSSGLPVANRQQLVANLKPCTQLFELLVDQQPKAPHLQMRLYNMIMDGYFIHSQHSRDLPRHVRPYRFLRQAVQRGLPLGTDTLNIWVRGLALFHHDLTAAESLLQWMTKRRGVQWDELTVYYLTLAALARGQTTKVQQWITQYEQQHTIQGSGLLYFKSLVMP